MDQEEKRALLIIEFPNHLPGLLGDPHFVRMGSDPSQMHAACAQFEEEEDIQGLEQDRLDGEEVTCKDLLFVMGHQVLPADRAIANW